MQGKPRAARQPYEDFPRGRFCKRIPVWHARARDVSAKASRDFDVLELGGRCRDCAFRGNAFSEFLERFFG